MGRGERLGIIGRNGAGKSTLLKLVSGVIPATSGSIRVEGNARALLEIGTGFHPEFTGRDNARAYFAQLGTAGREAAALIEAVIEFSELEEYIDQPLKTYSTGMRLRLMFATATVVAPDILVLDEVLGVGDAYFTRKSFERINEISQREGATLLLVSHDIYTSARICERMIWLEKGRVALRRRPQRDRQGIRGFHSPAGGSAATGEVALSPATRSSNACRDEQRRVSPGRGGHTRRSPSRRRPFGCARYASSQTTMSWPPCRWLQKGLTALPLIWRGPAGAPSASGMVFPLDRCKISGPPFIGWLVPLLLSRQLRRRNEVFVLALDWGADTSVDLLVSCRVGQHLVARHQLGIGGNQWEHSELPFPSSAEDGAAIEQAPERAAVFGTGRIRLTGARLLDAAGHETFTFWHGDPFRLLFDYQSEIPTWMSAVTSPSLSSGAGWTRLAAFSHGRCASTTVALKKVPSKWI